MACIKKIKTKSGIEILRHSSSMMVAGRPIFNGSPFNDAHMKIIKNAMDEAYELGIKAQINKVKKILNIN